MEALPLGAAPQHRAGLRIFPLHRHRAAELLIDVAAVVPSRPPRVVPRAVITATPPIRTAPSIGSVVCVVGLIRPVADDVDVGILINAPHPTSLELCGNGRVRALALE